MPIAEIVLASSSPRRRALLTALGFRFTVDAADIDEGALPGETPPALVRRLSHKKAVAVHERHADMTVLAADTIVVLDGQILGKPRDPGEAVNMLVALRGRMHEVYTAVSVAGLGSEAPAAVATDVCCSNVWMRQYSDAEIQAYVTTGDPLDKAGAYAIQHPSFSPSNVGKAATQASWACPWRWRPVCSSKQGSPFQRW